MKAIETIKQANEIVGGLSSPSKMPGYCISLSASKCNMGSKLRKVKGSVCEHCYACKGRYCFEPTKKAHARRLEALSNSQWIDAMVYLINKRAKKNPEFRWHDSGDIQSLQHLINIVAVVKQTPTVKHWIPTKEYKVVKEYLKKFGAFPSNLCVRVSMPMVRQTPKSYCGQPTSTVDSGKGFKCPVTKGDQTCDMFNCRACWDKDCLNVDYGSH